MPDDRKRKPPTPTGRVPSTRAADIAVGAPLPGTAGVTTLPEGGILAGAAPGALSTPLGLEADASQEFAEFAPTFGDVLLSIGTGVASSQDALDRGMVTSAKQLSQKKIKIVSEVVQKLDDDGLPRASATELVTEDVSLINFISPTVHEWKNVSLSMDLEVGRIDQETGYTFKSKQKETNTHAYGLFWGFVGWYDTDDKTTQTFNTSNFRRESSWSAGQVRLDAHMAPRTTGKFPVPAEVTIGPQIYLSQGSVSEVVDNGAVTSRSLDILVQVRKANGQPSPTVNVEVDLDRFGYSFSATDPFTGSTTNAQGEAKLTVTRDIPSALFAGRMRAKLTCRLGRVSKTLEITL